VASILPPLSPNALELAPGASLALLVLFPQPVRPGPGPLRSATVHALVGRLLGQLMRADSGALRIARTQQGKPYIEGANPVRFNVSHAQAYSLIALSLSDDIGCDIEDRFEAADVDRLGPLVLHPDEAEALNRLHGQERQDAFRRCWVRKEAQLKAGGTGFLGDPRHARPEDSGWHFHEKQIDARCTAAVASMDSACSWYAVTVPEPG
jgi:4'-phosphopantetheinyl transferase